MKELIRYNKYSRRDVHEIFSPNTEFKRGSDWGRSGIIKIPGTLHDYIFLVTYGQKQSDHAFEEKIDEEGILTWQSQPKQKLSTPQIKTFIDHDYTKDNIHLFLRENDKIDYTYLGLLAYVDHDNEREKSVYFKWQILDWDTKQAQKTIKDVKENIMIYETAEINAKRFKLTLKEDDNGYYITTERKGKNTKEFGSNRNTNFIEKDQKNSKLGDLGKDIVVEYEKKELIKQGRKDLINDIKPTREFIGNTAKYDVRSFDKSGNEKYIEVKTTTGSVNNEFHISDREVEFSQNHGENYFLYRVYNLDANTMTADLKIKKGPIEIEKLTARKFTGRIGDLL